jgi:hypothetical protein
MVNKESEESGIDMQIDGEEEEPFKMELEHD